MTGGLVMKSLWDMAADIEAGELAIVLPGVRLPAAPIHAVFPHSRLTAAKVRLCVEFLAMSLRRRRSQCLSFGSSCDSIRDASPD